MPSVVMGLLTVLYFALFESRSVGIGWYRVDRGDVVSFTNTHCLWQTGRAAHSTRDRSIYTGYKHKSSGLIIGGG